jgi:Nucleotidyl transferase AbiEii toxin, Type IV TA system
MARRYGSPADFKQSLEDRLRRSAEKPGETLDRLRRRGVFERFLARVVVHFGDRVVVKGGVALQLRVHGARATRDIDLRLTGDASRLLADLREAGQLPLDGDFLTFLVDPDPRHPTIEGEGIVYEGQRFRVEAKLAGKIYGSRFGVDVGFGDRMACPPEVLSAGDLFDFAGFPPVSVRVYAREVHVAEKLHALTLPRARPNSRVKDLPDLAFLATTGLFDSGMLRDAIRATFAQRGSHEVPAAIPDPPPSWAAPYEEMVAENLLPWPTLDVLTLAVRAFLDPVLGGEDGAWDPKTWAWTRQSMSQK